MKRVILLKTQLAEAAKLAGSPDFAKQRLAVILLDNFIEIQLMEFMKSRFAHDDWYTSRPPRYSFDQRKQILYNYKDLLKACVSEDIIQADERELLFFCHDVRNNLYHQANEEPLLTFIALLLLNDLILKYQSEWKSGRDFSSWDMKTVDPYAAGKGQDDFSHDFNSKQNWELFLKTHFESAIDRSKTPSALIAAHLLAKLEKSRYYYQFLLDNYSDFSSDSQDWKLNDYLQFYSFYNVKEFELKAAKAGTQVQDYNRVHHELFRDYRQKWVYVKDSRLDTLEGHFNKIAGLTSFQALKKLMAYRAEMGMIHDALASAAAALDEQIEAAIDVARESARD